MSNKKRYLIVDDHEFVSGGLSYYLQKAGVEAECTIASNFETAKTHLSETSFDLHIFDISLPDGSGVELLKLVKESNKSGPVILLTGSATVLELQQGQRLGADGLISKTEQSNCILEAIGMVEDGKKYISHQIGEQIGHVSSVSLTPRMQTILTLLAEGLSNKEMAYRLSMSEPTVSFHLRGLRGRLGAQSNRDTLKKAKELGFLK